MNSACYHRDESGGRWVTPASKRFVILICILIVAIFVSERAFADNICYQYDSLGRLVGTMTTPGPCPASLPDPGAQPSNSTVQKITYDRAGNRTRYEVAGAEAYSQKKVIVLPLNGFTIIPLGN